ncbi:MAG: hypothetical protein FWH15_01805 [Betaproteobacteria bacterium]|nr:hypothetical protein [Betaproteobacteria bacterium]
MHKQNTGIRKTIAAVGATVPGRPFPHNGRITAVGADLCVCPKGEHAGSPLHAPLPLAQMSFQHACPREGGKLESTMNVSA